MKGWIWITGAGTGIGAAAAKRFEKEGYGLVLTGRTESTLEKVKNSLQDPEKHRLLIADIGKPETLQHGLVDLDIPSLYAVIANAGVGGENQYGEHDRWDEVINTNLTGTYHTVNLALPFLRKDQGEGEFRHVVVISSVLARLGVPGYSAYCASKAGLLGLTRSWAAAWASKRILVNALCPGWVETEMARQGLETFAEATGKSYEQILKEQMSMVPLRKMSQPEEIADFCGYLVCGGQTSITGQALDINNGAQMP